MGKNKKIESVFDVEIETGDGNGKLEKVIVKPNPDRVGVLSVFLKKGEFEPRKYYDLSVQRGDCGTINLLIEGDDRCAFIELGGNKVRWSIGKVPEKIGEVITKGLLVYLERSFTKLKIEATIGKILFTAT